MFNKPLLRFAISLGLLGALDFLFVFYFWLRCVQTHSSFYCDAFAFGAILLIPGIPALILIALSIIFIIAAKLYKKEISSVTRGIFVILIVLLIGLHCVPFFMPSFQPRTYSEFLAQRGEYRLETIRIEQQKCEDYKLRTRQWKEGMPMPVPPSRDCEI